MDVILVVTQDLLLAGRFPLGILVDGLPEAGQVLVSLALSEPGHLVSDTRYFLEPNLMDLGRGDVDRGHRFHGFGIAPLPVYEAFDRKLGTSFWRVLSAQKIRKLAVRRKHVVVDAFGDLAGQVFLVLL